jgi:site-specific recombinase XerD
MSIQGVYSFCVLKELDFEPRRADLRGKEKWRIYLGKNSNGTPQYSRRFDTYEECEAVATKHRVKAAKQQSRSVKQALTHEEKIIQGQLSRLEQIGISLQQCVDYYFETNFPKKGVVGAAQCVEDFIEAKRKANKGDKTIEQYERQLKPFAEHFGEKPIHSISTDDLNEYFDTIVTWNNNTKHQGMRFMKTFFNWLENLKFLAIAAGQKNAAATLEVPERDLSTPKIASWEEVYDMLIWYNTRATSVGGFKKGNIFGSMVYLVFCLFLGIRKSEAFEITWDDVDFKNRNVSILVEGSKTDRRRVNELPENIWNWLLYLKQQGAVLNPKTADRRLAYQQRKYRETFTNRGATVPDIVATEIKQERSGKRVPKEKYHNIMRHSFCGHHLKHYQSAGKTALLMGNSEKKVRSDYYEIVKNPLDARMYFEMPAPGKPVWIEGEEAIPTLDQAVKAWCVCQRLSGMFNGFDKTQKAEYFDMYREYNDIVQRYPTFQEIASALEWDDGNEDVHTTDAGIKYKLT